MKSHRCDVIAIGLALLIFSCKGSSKDQAQVDIATQGIKAPANVIIILADDAGFIDFGFMGSEDLETPNLDGLAKGGVTFTDAHVTSTVCAPSRAGLITGKYQQRFGFEANGTGKYGLSHDVVTMADVFQANGYNTYALGKWHLNADDSDHPNQRGFDEYYGFLTGSRSYFPIENPSRSKMLQHNGKRVKWEGYMTDELGDQSVKFAEESRNRPFFMYLAYNAVHTPMDAKEEDLERFKDHPRQKLASMTWSLDENVGKLVKKLEELGIRDNTLIYFLSDNGGAPNNDSKMGPLKGWKGKEFEGGHRVPFVVNWPQEIEGGSRFDGLTSSLDIFPTSLAAGGIAKPSDLVLDGTNLIPYINGDKDGDPHKQLFWRKLDKSAARVGDYKTVSLEGYGSVMYDLKIDMGETKDLSVSQKDTFARVMRDYKNWETKLIPPLWDEGKAFMDFSSKIHKMLMQNEEPPYRSLGGMRRYEKEQE